jgi:hypothetical protein
VCAKYVFRSVGSGMSKHNEKLSVTVLPHILMKLIMFIYTIIFNASNVYSLIHGA